MGHYASYSPTNGGPPSQAGYTPAYASRPSSSAAMSVPPGMTSSQSPRLGPPLSPPHGLPPPLSRSNYPSQHQTAKSTYYDPTLDHREGSAGWTQPSPSYVNRSPSQVRHLSHQKPENVFMRESKLTNHSVSLPPTTANTTKPPATTTTLPILPTSQDSRRPIHSQICTLILQRHTSPQSIQPMVWQTLCRLG